MTTVVLSIELELDLNGLNHRSNLRFQYFQSVIAIDQIELAVFIVETHRYS